MDVIEIERMLLTTYRKNIFRPFTKAIMDYKLLENGDKVCVCLSGGKDSFLMAKCMQEFERHGKVNISCEYVLMDPGYLLSNVSEIMDNAHKLGIPLKIFKSDIFNRVEKSENKSPCYVCAKMRRGSLYDYARSIGCNKIALGHHFDDVITTTLMSILYGGVFNTMVPKVNAENFPGMQMIRPLYLVREKDISSFMKKCEIKLSSYKCPLKKEDSKRKEIKALIEKLKETNKFVDYNIFKSSENVELNNIRGAIKNKEKIDYLEYFDKYL